MAASDSTLESQAEDLLSDLTSNTVEEYRIGNRMVKRPHANIDKVFKTLMQLRGLQSSKRGMNVAQIERPQ